jgi:hypothetical protein
MWCQSCHWKSYNADASAEYLLLLLRFPISAFTFILCHCFPYFIPSHSHREKHETIACQKFGPSAITAKRAVLYLSVHLCLNVRGHRYYLEKKWRETWPSFDTFDLWPGSHSRLWTPQPLRSSWHELVEIYLADIELKFRQAVRSLSCLWCFGISMKSDQNSRLLSGIAVHLDAFLIFSCDLWDSLLNTARESELGGPYSYSLYPAPTGRDWRGLIVCLWAMLKSFSSHPGNAKGPFRRPPQTFPYIVNLRYSGYKWRQDLTSFWVSRPEVRYAVEKQTQIILFFAPINDSTKIGLDGGSRIATMNLCFVPWICIRKLKSRL